MEPSVQRFLLNLDSYLPRLHRSVQGKYIGGGKVSLGADNLPACCQGQRREEGEASVLGEGVPQSIPTGTAQLIVEKPQAKRCMGVCRGVYGV